jgi:hypothetical protein
MIVDTHVSLQYCLTLLQLKWLQNDNTISRKNPLNCSQQPQLQTDNIFTVRRGEDNGRYFKIPFKRNTNLRTLNKNKIVL